MAAPENNVPLAETAPHVVLASLSSCCPGCCEDDGCCSAETACC
jgi:hypothetical protein